MTDKEAAVKKMLEKYHGTTFVEVSKVEEIIKEIKQKIGHVRTQLFEGKVYKMDICKHKCACSGYCYPNDLQEIENSVYKAYKVLIYGDTSDENN